VKESETVTRVNVYWYPIIAIVLFMGIIQLSRLTPYWNTSSRTLGADTSVIEIHTDSGVTTVYDTADIRGSWVLKDVVDKFQIPLADITTTYGLPAEVPDSTALKDLKQYNPEFDVETFRDWVKEKSPVAKK
jgi:hypothetical protein